MARVGRQRSPWVSLMFRMADRVRILIADDHEIIRQTLRYLLERRSDWEICGETSTGRDAVRLATQRKPDIALLDLSMPDLDGVGATLQIRQSSPKTKILIFSMHDSEDLARQVLAAGAHGYVVKSDATPHIEAAIDALVQGKSYFTPAITETLMKIMTRRGDAPAPPSEISLTPRERDVLRLLAEGGSNKDIARHLDLSVATVQSHRATIMRKLDLNSLAALVRYAVRHKIIDA